MNPNYLDFEQPIAELEMKIEELQGVSDGCRSQSWRGNRPSA
jgi:acetyl-CoA carboxylase alpha subunit